MHPDVHTIIVYLMFLAGNVGHMLVIAYQFVQAAKKFPDYKSWWVAFRVPVTIRTILLLCIFAVVYQNPQLLSFLGSEAKISMTGAVAFIIGYTADNLLAFVAQTFGDKLPFLKVLVAEIPSSPEAK